MWLDPREARTALKSFEASIEKAFADGGFTMFSAVHSAQPRFKVAEIVEQVRTALRFVHAHAADYGIDAPPWWGIWNQLGWASRTHDSRLTGFSHGRGGHHDKTFGSGVINALQWFKGRLLK